MRPQRHGSTRTPKRSGGGGSGSRTPHPLVPTQWRQQLEQIGLSLEIESAIATLDVLDELRVEIAAQSDLQGRLDGMVRDTGEHDTRVIAVADALGIPAAKETSDRLALMRTRLTTARATATVHDTLQATVAVATRRWRLRTPS